MKCDCKDCNNQIYGGVLYNTDELYVYCEKHFKEIEQFRDRHLLGKILTKEEFNEQVSELSSKS